MTQVKPRMSCYSSRNESSLFSSSASSLDDFGQAVGFCRFDFAEHLLRSGVMDDQPKQIAIEVTVFTGEKPLKLVQLEMMTAQEGDSAEAYIYKIEQGVRRLGGIWDPTGRTFYRENAVLSYSVSNSQSTWERLGAAAGN